MLNRFLFGFFLYVLNTVVCSQFVINCVVSIVCIDYVFKLAKDLTFIIVSVMVHGHTVLDVT